MKIYQIDQDSQGVLWIGIENGLVSYNGELFHRFTHPDLIDNDIIRIALNPEGRLYFMNLSMQIGYIDNGEIGLIQMEDTSLRLLEEKSRNR